MCGRSSLLITERPPARRTGRGVAAAIGQADGVGGLFSWAVEWLPGCPSTMSPVLSTLVSTRKLGRGPQVRQGDCVGKGCVVIVLPCVGCCVVIGSVELEFCRTPLAPFGSRVSVRVSGPRYGRLRGRGASGDDPFPSAHCGSTACGLDKDFQGESVLQLRATGSRPGSPDLVCQPLRSVPVPTTNLRSTSTPEAPEATPASSAAALTASVAVRCLLRLHRAPGGRS